VNKLLTMYQQNKLSPFIIYKGEQSLVANHVTQLLQTVLSKEEGIAPEKAIAKIANGHQDILFLNPQEESNYNVDDLGEFFSFIQFSPYHLTKRFIVFNSSEKLTTTVSNKLLKSLEETPPNIIVIFIAPKEFSFIQTIESRAFIMRGHGEEIHQMIEAMPLGKIEAIEQSSLAQNVKEILIEIIKTKNGIHKLGTVLSGNKTVASDIAKVLLEIQAGIESDYELKDHFLRSIKLFQSSQTYNSSSFARTSILIRDLLVDSDSKISQYS